MTQLELEKTVIEHLLYGDNKHVAEMKRQFENSTTTKREFTGRGFFTEYQYPDNLKNGNISGRIAGVGVGIENSKDIMDFILFINDGGIDTLEGYVFLDDWYEKDIDKIDETSFYFGEPDVRIKESKKNEK